MLFSISNAHSIVIIIDSIIRPVSYELLPFVALFEKETGVVVDFEVRLGTIKNNYRSPRNTVGFCFTQEFWPRHVVISRSFWTTATYYQKEEAVLHELGHCSLDLEHDGDLLWRNGTFGPKSIMYELEFGSTKHYVRNRKYFLNELKNKK